MKEKISSAILRTFLGTCAVAGLALFGMAAFASLPARAQVHISASIPGSYDTSNASGTAPGAFIADFYQYALVIGGVLAFGVIVYGGIRYMTSAGNPSGQTDAKDWIQAAIMGLLLLAGTYFILKVINPSLVNLNLPNPGQPGTYAGDAGTPPATPPGTPPQNAFENVNGNATCNGATCPTGQTCHSTQVNLGGGKIQTTWACK